MELQTLIIIFLAFTAYAITPLSHNTLNLRRFNMTNLMKSLGYQVIKILPSWCFKEALLGSPHNIDVNPEGDPALDPDFNRRAWGKYLGKSKIIRGRYKVSLKGWIAKNSIDMSRQELIDLAISQNEMLNEREDELYEIQNEETSIFKVRINWIVMYVIGICMGASLVFLYQALQSTYKLL